MGVRRQAPLTFATLEPIVGRSRVGAFAGRALDALARAIAAAAVVALLSGVVARLRSDPPAVMVSRGAWLIAVAGLTHIAMLLFVERYHYPSRAALVLPGVIVVVALIAMRMGNNIARAIADRSQR